MANITSKCWNCGSSEKWTEVVSMEKCDNCGIACYYHGEGANQAYLDAMDERYAREERQRQDAERREREEWEEWEEQERSRDEDYDPYSNVSEHW